MAGAFIKIEVDDREVRERLEDLRRLMGDLEPVLHDIGTHLERSHRQRFERSEAPDGSKWAPNSAVTFDQLASGGLLTKRGKLNKEGVGRLAARSR
ncbi:MULTISPECIES: phage virion morphogenesis protein [Methylococcus]|uniref:Phage virion morphogenesis protein n=1 Tax=Methylococcus capsulatus TaxID=414 RepID=A0ABZ2F115_METCP|nr:phage virion morphogenesis protein [Methylococcus sp. BF19-07]